MIVTKMFVISYDLSWFALLKNSHTLLLVQIIVHIDDAIKMLTSSKLLTSSKIFVAGFFGLFLILLNYLVFFGDDDNIHSYFYFLLQYVIKQY